MKGGQGRGLAPNPERENTVEGERTLGAGQQKGEDIERETELRGRKAAS